MDDPRGRGAVQVEPDLASRQAAIAAVGWLVIAVLLQVLVQARTLFPDVLGGLPLLSYGRLRPMADSAFLLGWLGAVGFCAMFAIVPRAVGAQLHNEILGATSVLAWNVALMAGIATLALGMNQGRALAELPLGVDLALVALSLFIFYDVTMTAVRRNEDRLFVSVWYLAAAALLFPVIFAAGNLTAFTGVRDAILGAFYLGALEFLWLVPVGLGIAYYVIPAASRSAVPSRSLARIGFWTLMLAGGWTGIRYLVGGPIPEYLEAIGVAMTFVVLIPVITAASNLLGTVRSRWDLVMHAPALRYATVAVITLVGWATLSALSSIPSVSRLVGLTAWHSGLRVLAWVGVFSFFGFALLSYVYPLLVGRDWYSRRATSFHLWATLAGMTVVAAVHMAVGLAQGAMSVTVSRVGDPDLGPAASHHLVEVMRGTQWVALAGWLLVAAAQLVFAWNCARTARAGEPVQLYAMTAEPAGSVV